MLTQCPNHDSGLGGVAGYHWQRQEESAHSSQKVEAHRLVEVHVLKEKARHQVDHEERLKAQLTPKQMCSRAAS